MKTSLITGLQRLDQNDEIQNCDSGFTEVKPTENKTSHAVEQV